MRATRLVPAVLAYATLAASSAGAVAAHAADQPEVTASTTACATPAPALADQVDSLPTAQRPGALEWLQAPGVEGQLAELQALAERSPVVAGYSIDLAAQRLRVVSASAGRAVGRDELPPGPLRLDPTPACRDAGVAQAEFEALKDWVADRLSSAIGASVELDVATGLSVITVSGESAESFTRELSSAFPDVYIKRATGTFVSDIGSRGNDGSPHYGGARIVVNGSSNCTSGFRMVEKSNGRTWMLTAAHCYNGTNQVRVENGAGGYFGTTKYTGLLDRRDIMLIGATSNTYSNSMYLNPDTFTRSMRGTYDVPLYGAACANGATSLATCGLTVESRDVLFCPTDGFCRDTDRLIRAGYAYPWQGGDSGGALYGKNTSTTVNGRGIISGSFPVPQGSTGYGYYTPIRLIQSYYGGGFSLP